MKLAEKHLKSRECFLDVVHKPFDLDTLARTVRHALDVASPA